MSDLNNKPNRGPEIVVTTGSHNLTKEELFAMLSKGENPYANCSGYTPLREKYGNDPAYTIFFEKISYNEQGDLKYGNMLFRKNEYNNYLLTAPHNGRTVVIGNHEDINGNKGLLGVTYISGVVVEEIVKNQQKKLFKTLPEVDMFISSFPGEAQNEKIRAFITLFGLQAAGYFEPFHDSYSCVDFSTSVALSGILDDKFIYIVTSNNIDNERITYTGSVYPMPFLAFEELPD